MVFSLFRRIGPIAALIAAPIIGCCPAVQAEPDRIETLLSTMTQAEKETLIYSAFGSVFPDKNYRPIAGALIGSAGYTPGIARLGITPQWETDATLGVATQFSSPDPLRERTGLPSGIATAASWNPALAEQAGAMIGAEARQSGFNILLAGGVNLIRDPRNGRNFEYASEDPLLSGVMVGAAVRGIQTNHIVATLKHFALNDQETGRSVLDAQIPEDLARQSDLLAFELALEQGRPGSVMCAYNRVNGIYACENDFLLNQVLKRDWGFKGWVMSDWGAVHSTGRAAMAGLDQESGAVFDDQPYFAPDRIAKALADKSLDPARLDDMVRRILWGMVTTGALDHPVAPQQIDFVPHAEVTAADAEEGIVLLKNQNHILPLSPSLRKIAVIGSHADKGVMSGGGSAAVVGVGGNAVPGLGPTGFPGPITYHPSAPLVELRRLMPNSVFTYDEGNDIAQATKLARDSDAVILFAHQWTAESIDAAMALDDDQDALIAAAAEATSALVVVLETGGPVRMPWLSQISALVEAWYPGTQGGLALARLLTGAVNPSGHLPISFPRDLSQLPRLELDGAGLPPGQAFSVSYHEGAAVGYKWFDRTGSKPLFPFGFGLSYTDFTLSGLKAELTPAGLRLRGLVGNRGNRGGQAVPQFYIGPVAGGWEAPRRLAGWQKLSLVPRMTGEISVTVDPRLLSRFDSAQQRWIRAAGRYRVELASSAGDIAETVEIDLPEQSWPAQFTAR